jgi:hypothetical protein
METGSRSPRDAGNHQPNDATEEAGARPTAIDPHNVAETFCAGPFHVHTAGDFAVMTFTQARIAAEALFHYGDDRLEGVAKSHARYVVVARLALPVAAIFELRDTLNRLTKNAGPESHAVGGTQH